MYRSSKEALRARWQAQTERERNRASLVSPKVSCCSHIPPVFATYCGVMLPQIVPVTRSADFAGERAPRRVYVVSFHLLLRFNDSYLLVNDRKLVPQAVGGVVQAELVGCRLQHAKLLVRTVLPLNLLRNRPNYIPECVVHYSGLPNR